MTHQKKNLRRGCGGVGGRGLCTFNMQSSKTGQGV
jgi:hypothetical protein